MSSHKLMVECGRYQRQYYVKIATQTCSRRKCTFYFKAQPTFLKEENNSLSHL